MGSLAQRLGHQRQARDGDRVRNTSPSEVREQILIYEIQEKSRGKVQFIHQVKVQESEKKLPNAKENPETRI